MSTRRRARADGTTRPPEGASTDSSFRAAGGALLDHKPNLAATRAPRAPERKVGRPQPLVAQQLFRRCGDHKVDRAVLDDVTAVRDTEGVHDVLLDDQHRQSPLADLL